MFSRGKSDDNRLALLTFLYGEVHQNNCANNNFLTRLLNLLHVKICTNIYKSPLVQIFGKHEISWPKLIKKGNLASHWRNFQHALNFSFFFWRGLLRETLTSSMFQYTLVNCTEAKSCSRRTTRNKGKFLVIPGKHILPFTFDLRSETDGPHKQNLVN